MNTHKNSVSYHPYFTIYPGKRDEVEALLARLVEATSTEEKCLFYNFTMNGDHLFCREAYIGAEGAQAHLANVGALIEELLKVSPNYTLAKVASSMPYKHEQDRDRYINALREAGLPET